MNLAVILYHKDIYSIYTERWVEKCLDSLKNQTHKHFTVFELCYSEKSSRLLKKSVHFHVPMVNHIAAMNFIIDRAFDNDADVVANINLDDYYHPDRLKLQLEAINQGYDLVSSNFEHIEEINGVDTHVRSMCFSDRNIKHELNSGHNVIAHPSVMMTKKFWEKYKYYDVNELGYEDRSLWTKAINDGCKMVILPQILLHYRLSPKQTGRIYTDNGKKR